MAELLPESLRSQAESYRKGTDTMDVWFDSGEGQGSSSHLSIISQSFHIIATLIKCMS